MCVALTENIGEYRAGKAENIKAEMFVKTMIFNGNYRIGQVFRQFIRSNNLRINIAELGNIIAVFGHNNGGWLAGATYCLLNIGHGNIAIKNISAYKQKQQKSGKQKKLK